MHWTGQSDGGRICLVGMEGSLSATDLVNLSERLRGLAVQGVSRVVVDLRNVEHWDFRGLRSLADAVDYRRNFGWLTAFIIPNRYLRDIAAAAGVLERLDVYDALRLEDTEADDGTGSLSEVVDLRASGP